jgi:hypothetical protein
MPSTELENLVAIASLKREACTASEFAGLVHSGLQRLADARNDALSLEGRFDLAYNAAHALSLAALRHRGYRPANRFIVFQSLAHSLGIATSTWRVLDTAHRRRNLAEYEGVVDVDAALVDGVIAAAEIVAQAVKQLPPIPAP